MSSTHPYLDRVAPIFARGIQLLFDGRTEEALGAFEECLAIAPANPQMHLQAGLASLRLEQWWKGIAHLRVAVAADPRVAEGWMHLAAAFHHVGRLDEARRVGERAVALKPTLAEGWNTLGLVELESGNYERGREHLLKALQVDPRLAVARMNVGVCEHGLGRDDDAAASFEAALAMEPGLAQAQYNLGTLRHKQARHEEAVAHYREAIGLRPRDPQAHMNVATALFSLGRFEEGWREYAWRVQRLNYAAALQREERAYVIPTPERIRGARLAVLAEQGLGDILFFLRFLPQLRPHVASVDFAGDPRLQPMLWRTHLFASFAERPEDLPPGERVDVLAGDLALILPGASASTPPPFALSADAQRADAMRERLAASGPPPYVGLAWRAGEPRSGTGLRENLFKEVPVAALGTALRESRATWVAIQRDPRPGEIDALSAALGAPVHDLTGTNADLEDALALLAVLDEYVGVSSTLIHLRAGLGGSARVTVPFPPEWRWMESGARSPWFPRATVYRQAGNGDWSAPLAQLAADLRSGLTSR